MIDPLIINISMHFLNSHFAEILEKEPSKTLGDIQHDIVCKSLKSNSELLEYFPRSGFSDEVSPVFLKNVIYLPLVAYLCNSQHNQLYSQSIFEIEFVKDPTNYFSNIGVGSVKISDKKEDIIVFLNHWFAAFYLILNDRNVFLHTLQDFKSEFEN